MEAVILTGCVVALFMTGFGAGWSVCAARHWRDCNAAQRRRATDRRPAAPVVKADPQTRVASDAAKRGPPGGRLAQFWDSKDLD